MNNINGIHFLLTYSCNFECDHCFLYCGPRATGTFTIAQVRRVLDEAEALGTVEEVFFEGGEPLLYFPLLVESIRQAKARGFSTGLVTNGYWSTAIEDAGLWLEPLVAAGLDSLSLSEDTFHGADDAAGPAQWASEAASAAGLSAGVICIEPPTLSRGADDKGAPVVGGGALFKGRAADKLTAGLPTRPADAFSACEHEELVTPGRVHVDCFGNVHICQGVVLGSVWREPLARLLASYEPARHPILGPLVRGGPRALAEAYGVPLDGRSFVDACHCCFEVRRALVARYPEHLAPRQVYGEV